MINFFKNLLSTQAIDFQKLVADGAVILDVRTPTEFSSGHIQGAINIPLQTLSSGLNKLDKSTTIITCCASGVRSASARTQLLKAGFTDVHNGGGWMALQGKLLNGK
jgi:phage shock protein E